MTITDQIKEKVNIVDVARRAGYEPDRSNFIKSIYRDEKTPSLRLYPESNSYCDFGGDNRGGSVIDFYMDLHNLPLNEAIRELANIAGIEQTESKYISDKREIDPEVKEFNNCFDLKKVAAMTADEKEIFWTKVGMQTNAAPDLRVRLTPKNIWKLNKIEKNALREVIKFRLEKNREVFQELLNYMWNKGPGKEAGKYMIEARSFDPAVLFHFRIYHIKNYFEVNNHLKKTFPLEQLQKSGLFSTKGNLIFYKHRIVIPYIYNDSPIYLRARYFDENGDESGKPKYIGLINDALDVNTARRWYNIDVIKNSLPGEKIYITEGEFDTVAIEQMGYNAIAVPGAGNLPDDHWIKALKDFTVILCIDNDNAGNKLLENLGGKLTSFGIQYSVKKLPAKDANEFLKSFS